MAAIKILALESEMIDAVGYWRVYQPFQAMRALFPGVFDVTYKREKLTYADIASHDIVFMTRPDDAKMIEFLQNFKLHSVGGKVIIDCDDDYFNLPISHSMSAGFQKSHQSRLKVTEQAWNIADCVWFSTDFLTNKYGPKLRQAHTMPNAVFPDLLPDAPAPDRRRIAWRGHSIQNHDLMIEGQKTFGQIYDKCNYFAWIGYMPPLDLCSRYGVHYPMNREGREKLFEAKTKIGKAPIVLYPTIPNPADYIRQLSIEKFNVVWKPLIDHDFNRAKSNIAYIEATISGGYCLTNFAGSEQWENASDKWLSYDDACELWAKAKADILDNYNLWNTARMRAATIFNLLGLQVPTKQAADVAP